MYRYSQSRWFGNFIVPEIGLILYIDIATNMTQRGAKYFDIQPFLLIRPSVLQHGQGGFSGNKKPVKPDFVQLDRVTPVGEITLTLSQSQVGWRGGSEIRITLYQMCIFQVPFYVGSLKTGREILYR